MFDLSGRRLWLPAADAGLGLEIGKALPGPAPGR